MHDPWTWIVSHEADGDIASSISSANDVSPDRIEIVGFSLSCAFNDAEWMLKIEVSMRA